MQRYALRDDQWAEIQGFLPGRDGHVGGTAPDNRLFVDAIVYRYRTGIPWRDLPERYGKWKPTHKRFRRWCESGVFARFLAILARDPDAEYMSIDYRPLCVHISTVPAPKKDGEDQAIGRSRGGLTTKIHAIVDALGNPVALSLTPGQAHDITQAVPLLDQVEPEAFLADKGYDSDALVETLKERGITPVIPSKANRKVPRKTDFALYRERNLVERFFCKIKQYRAISTRYDKLANTFLAAVALVCILLWLN